MEAIWEGSGEREERIDLEGHGREGLFPELDLSRTVGWFTTSFPVRLRLEGEGPGEALKAVKEQLRRVPGRGLGYGVLRHLGPAEVRERLGRPPVARLRFNYPGRFQPGGAEAAPRRLSQAGPGPD